MHLNIFFWFDICRNCGEFQLSVCRGAGEKILYEWGRNSPKLELPSSKSVPSVYQQTLSCMSNINPSPLLHGGSPV